MSPNGISDGVLVTGGAGFVGVPLVERLSRLGPVVVVDDLSVGRPLPAEQPGLACHRLDVREGDALRAVMERHRPKTVVHLAAVHHIPTCEGNPRHATDVNVMGFQSVLDACTATGCRRVVLASSGAIYDWRDGALSETAPLAPRDVYSATKAANEHQLAAWISAGRGQGTIARMFNIIGPDDPNGHLIPDILGRLAVIARGGETVLRMGNLARRRDFVDLEDMASGLARLVEGGWSDRPAAGVYNLCSGTDHSVEDIALRLAAHMEVRVDLASDPTLCRPVDRPTQLGDPRKTLAELGWRTHRDLDDSIGAIVRTWQSRCRA